MTNQSVEMIRKDALIPVTIGTGFYARLREMLLYLLKDKSQEEILEANRQIESGNVTEDWIRHYETTVVLCKEIEKQASEHGMTYTSDLATEIEQIVAESETDTDEVITM
jgi:hypothetical protein